jgi:hypothetical protein
MKSIIRTGAVATAALLGLATSAWAQTAPTVAPGKTLETVKARGQLSCGVSTGNPGFSNPDDKGNWTGFDVDFCRAMAAAIAHRGPDDAGLYSDPAAGFVLAHRRLAILDLSPAAVVLLMGTNDLEEKASPETIAANAVLLLDALDLVEKAAQAGVHAGGAARAAP